MTSSTPIADPSAAALPPVGSRIWLSMVATAVNVGSEQSFEKKTTCIASTLMGCHYLGAHGIKATPTSVWVMAENLKGMRAREAQLPIAQWSDDAWSVVIRPGAKAQVDDSNPEDWTGHLVMLVRRGAGQPRTLIDPTAPQLSRPTHDLHVPTPVCLDIPAGVSWNPDEPYAKVIEENPENPTFVHYAPAPPGHPESGAWKTSKSFERWYDPRSNSVRQAIEALDGAMLDLAAMFAEEIALAAQTEPGTGKR